MTALQEALQKIISPQETSEWRSRVTQLFIQARRLIAEKEQLLAVEMLVMPEIVRGLDVLKQRLLALLPILSPEVFSWRDEKGQPTLAVVGLTEPTMEFRAYWHGFDDTVSDHDCDWQNFLERSGEEWDQYWSSSIRPNLPRSLRAYYRDVINSLRDSARQSAEKWNRDAQGKEYLEHRFDMGHGIECRFGGLIPTPTRERLVTAQSLFGATNIFLIFEALWINVPVRSDPIAAVWDGEHLRVLEVFDPTPLETLVADEFGC